MKLFNRLLAGVALAALATPAFADAKLPPTTDLTGKTVTPRGASVPLLVEQALAGRAPRSYYGLWKPHTGDASFDTGTTFANKTVNLAIEVPGDFTAARVLLGNQSGANDFTLSGCIASGSSQWGNAGSDTGFSPGITAYDDSGNAISTFSPCSFGNGGADLGDAATPKSTNPTAPVTSHQATTSTSSLTLTLSAANASIAVGQTVVTGQQSAGGGVLQPGTTVTGLVDSTHITVSAFPNIATTQTLYFLPAGQTVTHSLTPPVPNRAWSDWMPVTSYARRDGPIANGNTIEDNNGNQIGTVQSFDSLTATLTAPLSARLAAGAQGSPNIRVCQTINTTSDGAAPVTSLTLSDGTGLFAGMIAWLAGIPVQGTNSALQAPANPLTSVSGAVVGLTTPLGPNTSSGLTWANAATVWFELPSSLAGAVSSGVNTITVSLADAAKLTNGMQVRTGGFSGTVSNVNPATGVVTLSGNTTANMPSGMPVHFYISKTLSGAQTSAALLPISSTIGNPMILSGDRVEGAGIPADTFAWMVGQNGGISLTKSPTAQVLSGSPIRICKPMTTIADAAAGSSVLKFRQTTYPNKLFLLRLRFSGSPTNANYWNFNPSQQPYWNAAGLPAMEGASCTSDGVTTVSAISNSSGGCGRQNFIPIEAVQFFSPTAGILVGIGPGDSHFAGDTTPTGWMNMAQLAFAPLSTPDLPIWVANFAWGGKASPVFGPAFEPLIRTTKPSALVLPGWTWNDPFSVNGQRQALSNVASWAALVQQNGGIPIIVSEYQRQGFGSNAANASGDAYRLSVTAAEKRTLGRGLPFVDAACIMADPTNGSGYLDQAKSIDFIHGDIRGHTFMGVTGANGCPSLRTVAQPFLQY